MTSPLSSLRRRPVACVAIAAASLLALPTCGASKPSIPPAASPGPSSPPAASIPSPSEAPSRAGPSHIVLVVMENHEYGQVIGSPDAPFLNRLAREGVLLTNAFAITHPSLPNYLALLGGSTFGITSDCTTCHVSAENLIDQVEASGRTWRAYMEGMPSPCYRGAAFGRYAKKHDPFLYFDDIAGRPDRCADVVPLTRLDQDLGRNGLPAFAWITPDLCHDMHECPVGSGDAFLATWVPRIRPALEPDGVLLVAFDEGTTDAGCCRLAAGGHVAALLWGPGVRTGAELGSPADHYSLLREVEDAWGLGRLRAAACRCTPTLGRWEA